MQSKIEIKCIRMIADEEWEEAFADPTMTIAEEMLLYQQHHNEEETISDATQAAIHEDILSSANSGMYSSILTFEDRSRLYREQDTLYKMNDNIKYTKDEEHE